MKTITPTEYRAIVTDPAYLKKGRAFLAHIGEYLRRPDATQQEKDDCMHYLAEYDHPHFCEGVALVGFAETCEECRSDFGEQAALMHHKIHSQLTLLNWIALEMAEHPLREELRDLLRRLFDIFPAQIGKQD